MYGAFFVLIGAVLVLVVAAIPTAEDYRVNGMEEFGSKGNWTCSVVFLELQFLTMLYSCFISRNHVCRAYAIVLGEERKRKLILLARQPPPERTQCENRCREAGDLAQRRSWLLFPDRNDAREWSIHHRTRQSDWGGSEFERTRTPISQVQVKAESIQLEPSGQRCVRRAAHSNRIFGGCEGRWSNHKWSRPGNGLPKLLVVLLTSVPSIQRYIPLYSDIPSSSPL